MKRFLIWVSIILAIFFFFLVVVFLFIDALFDTEPIISQNSFVQANIGGSIPEYEPPDALEEYFRGSSLDMKRLRQSFKLAAVDDRIKGIILRISFIRTGYAKLDEIQQMIYKFRRSGKKVFAHLDYGLTRDYYLASACDSVFMSPGGNLFLTGLAAEVTFYKGMFSKLGIEADFEHVGEYKNAPDVYTRQSMSDSQREVINEILDARYQSLIYTIANNRGISNENVLKYIEQISGFSPEAAVESGLVDEIRYIDEVQDLFQGEANHISRTFATEYSRIDPASLGMEGDARIAVIYCIGAMTGGEDGSDPVMGKTLGANRVIRNIQRASEINSIKAIILRINSPGGSSLAADKIWHAVSEAAEKKPVIASISDVGASGGYYIALGADTIIAQDLSLIGSIGVYAGKFSLAKLYDKVELKNVVIRKGKNSGLFSLNSKFSESERIIVRRMIEDFYVKFVTKVAESRQHSFDEIDRIARGRVWNGKKGLEIDLIDELGGMDKAITIARQMADIQDSENIELIYYPKSRSVINQYFSRISIFTSFFNNPIERFEHYLSEIHMQPLSLMPFQPELE
jgi:protease-4